MQNNAGTFDYIIVGAGSAGCLLANRLSANNKNRVLLIEAGGKDNYPWIHIPVGYLYCIGNPRTDWCFKTAPEAGLHGRELVYPRGKVLGGCSSINGMIYMRGQAHDYDQWERMGNPGWGWNTVLPLFLKMEDHFDTLRPHHQQGGEWRVEKQRLSWPILDAFQRGAAQVGIPAIEDFNQGDNAGCAYFEVNQKHGVRWNTAKAFLHPVRNRPNLTVITKAEAEKLIFEGKQATGVLFTRQHTRWQAKAGKEIILAAGAIGSPTLLQRSGVGEGSLLNRLHIPVIHPLKGVGRNLQDHLQLRLVYKIKNATTLNQQANSLIGKLAMGWEYLLHRSGPLSMAPSQLGAFARSAPDQASANLEYHVQPLSLDKFGAPLHRFPAFTASVCDLHPLSRGQVTLQSPHLQDAPLIQPNYLTHPTDQEVAIQAIRLTRQIIRTPALTYYEPEEYKPGVHCQSDQELIDAAGSIGTTIFHPVGTCKMGPADDPDAVVDAQLKVHGLSNVRVADASIMPTITSGNTNSPTLMIAEKAAQMILQG